MEFKKYQHVERYGTSEVNGIEDGITYVFPKVDGTNASAWLDDSGEVRGGSRNRDLTLDKDNAGFYDAILKDERIKAYLHKHPTHRLYGEWLVPHSIKNYRDDAWRKFYIFDVCVDNDDKSSGVEYIPYDIYKPLLEEFGLDYISPLRIIKNGTYESYIKCLDENIFLLKDGTGTGEGIVIKNYDFYNRYGRQTWAKIVTSEFKEKHAKAMGAPQVDILMIEEKIVDTYVTRALVEKEHAKIVNSNNGEWSSKFIPQLLGVVWYSVVTEEMWNILKQFKNPTINFKTLQAIVTRRIKAVMPEIFN